jgi:tRNA-dihydrouridine synthase
MSNKLGIPDYLLADPIKRIQNDMSEPDTIVALMNKAFRKMEDHLRTDGRASTAGLMVMGGWIEAMFIATQLVYDQSNPDPEVVQKIAEQKYTLTSLLSFMKNYYDDPVVVYYTKKLKFLKNYFDTFEIYFKKGDLEIDTARQVFRSTGTEMTITVETLNNIRNYISKLRTEIVIP